MCQTVLDFLKSNSDSQQYDDCLILIEMMASVTSEPPVLWSNGLIGFGNHHYRYESGREGDWFNIGFAPRKGKLSIYIVAGFDAFVEALPNLGKFKTSKSCLYVRSLSEIDLKVLKDICFEANKIMHDRYPG